MQHVPVFMFRYFPDESWGQSLRPLRFRGSATEKDDSAVRKGCWDADPVLDVRGQPSDAVIKAKKDI